MNEARSVGRSVTVERENYHRDETGWKGEMKIRERWEILDVPQQKPYNPMEVYPSDFKVLERDTSSLSRS